MTKVINNIYFNSIENCGIPYRKSGVFLQLLVFSQAPVYALFFWLMTGSEVNAIYGFMFGSFATAVVSLYQCYKKDTGYCFGSGGVVGGYSKKLLWFARPSLIFILLVPYAHAF